MEGVMICNCHHPIGSGNGPCATCTSVRPDPRIIVRRIRAVYGRVTPGLIAVGPWHNVERA